MELYEAGCDYTVQRIFHAYGRVFKGLVVAFQGLVCRFQTWNLEIRQILFIFAPRNVTLHIV